MYYYKVLRPAEFEVLQQFGRFAGSPDDEQDGYIHLSTADQLLGTLNRHFADDEDVVIVKIMADKLGDAVRMEPSSGDELFPHLYGAILIGAVYEAIMPGREVGESWEEVPGIWGHVV